MTTATTDKHFSDADELFNYLLGMCFKSGYIYRGIKREIEKLPKIMRTWYNNGYHNLSEHEIDILKDFTKYGCSLINGSLNPIDIVSYAQHFGLPTRLIDWTRSPLIALYFSINGQDYDDEEYYRILTMVLDEQVVLSNTLSPVTLGDFQYSDSHSGINDYIRFLQTLEREESLNIAVNGYVSMEYGHLHIDTKSYSDFILEKIKSNKFIVLDLNHSNQRIIVQQGVFVIPKTLTNSSIDKQYDSSDVQTIYIDKALKDKLLDKLDALGINRKRLFFDIESICKDIVDSVMKIAIPLEKLIQDFDNQDK